MGKRWVLLAVLLTLCLLGERQAFLSAAGEAELPAKSRFVALTFDDGPGEDTTARLLDGLRERGASATFFLLGQEIAGNEGLLLRMRDEGHQVGNHSWSHADLQTLGDEALLQEVERTDALLRQILGEGEYWLRPPYGFLTSEQRQLLSVPVVKWSVDPEDWRLRDAEKDAAAVLERVQPGDIILMHDIFPATVEAALAVVDALQAEGYTFVTVQELLALAGVEPRAGVVYCSAADAEN